MDATSSSSSSTGSIRLHVPTNSLLVPNAAALLGFISGLTNAANLASLQFTAENAHRQPTTVKGWYFYQKTKNYKVIWAGFKGGFINGSKLGAWTAAFVAAQEGLDKVLIGNHLEPHQGRRAACGAVSGASFAFIISKLCEHSPTTAANCD